MILVIGRFVRSDERAAHELPECGDIDGAAHVEFEMRLAEGQL